MSKEKVAKPEKAKKSPLAMILVSLFALAATGIAGFTLYEIRGMKSQIAASNQSGNEQPVEDVAPPVPVAPVYIQLDNFTVSLMPTPEGDDRVLHIGLTLRVNEDSDKKLIEEYLPEIRSRLLVSLSRKTAQDLSSDEGKSTLIDQIKAEVGKNLSASQSATITDVLFNAFIIR